MWVPPEQLMKPEANKLFPFFSTLLDKGYTLFIVRHGSAPQFKVPEAVDDVRRAARFIHLNAEKFGVDPNRLGVCGGSAGGHLSMMLGTTGDDGKQDAPDEVDRASSRVRAVVAYFGPVDLREWAGPDAPARPKTLPLPALDFDPKLAESVSPLLHVTPDDAPTLLVHGDKDELVTLDNSERILKAFKQNKVETDLLVIKGAGHGFPGEQGARASQALVDWFDKHLAKPAESSAAEAKTEKAAAAP
jgi:acetyl esterase/lipase